MGSQADRLIDYELVDLFRGFRPVSSTVFYLYSHTHDVHVFCLFYTLYCHGIGLEYDNKTYSMANMLFWRLTCLHCTNIELIKFNKIINITWVKMFCIFIF